MDNEARIAYRYKIRRNNRILAHGVSTNLESTLSAYQARWPDAELFQVGPRTTYRNAMDWYKRRTSLVKEGRMGSRLIIPIVSDRQMEHIGRAEEELEKAGVTFDLGSDILDDGRVNRVWELDCSLRGARLEE